MVGLCRLGSNRHHENYVPGRATSAESRMSTRSAAARAGIKRSPLRAPPQRWIRAARTICNAGEAELLYPHVCTATLGLTLQMLAGAMADATDADALAIKEAFEHRGAFEKWCRRPRGRGIVRKIIKEARGRE